VKVKIFQEPMLSGGRDSMKRRVRRAVIGAGVLAAMLVLVLVLANWTTVRDQVEAWHFLWDGVDLPEPIDFQGA